jgi:hypothetical protein
MELSNTSTERLGDLADLTFKGQCYDSGRQSKARCTLCTRAIRLVYILKNPQDRSVPSGSCCFQKFRTVNPNLYKQLEGAKIWLETTVDAERQDTRANQPEVRDKMAVWRALKHQALLKIREYKRTTGKEWLPESLFELKVIVEKAPSPTATSRWYDNRIRELATKVQ